MENSDIFIDPNLYKPNATNKTEGLVFLKNIKDFVVSAIFLDPQYRGILDKLKYGNEGNRQTKRCLLPQMSEEAIGNFIVECDRILKNSGHLFLWLDKFQLCQGTQLKWIEPTHLKIVDMIVWNKNKMGMGYRTRKCSEYLVILQKEPIRAKGCFNDHSIMDVWTEEVPRNFEYPHRKPSKLQERLILATTKENDVICDPCAGSYGVLDSCRQLDRTFIGCDILG